MNKSIYQLAQEAFTALGFKQPPGKAYHMGFVDGYLARAKAEKSDDTKEKDEEPKSGAV